MGRHEVFVALKYQPTVMLRVMRTLRSAPSNENLTNHVGTVERSDKYLLCLVQRVEVGIGELNRTTGA